MPSGARTLLEVKIRERRQTLEEFAASIDAFAREHGEPGTLSVRHLKRLVAGRGINGAPLGPLRPATARLLEHFFGTSVDELLAQPGNGIRPSETDEELRERIRASSRVDAAMLGLLDDQLTSLRRLDRQLGTLVVHDEVVAKIDQVSALLSHSLRPAIRERIAALLSELCTLAGWQALDRANFTEAWRHYELGRLAASESSDPAFIAHTMAEQAFALIDLRETSSAVDLVASARSRPGHATDPLLRSWLAAAHGEALAADGQTSASLRAFDDAESRLPTERPHRSGPYVALDPVHLARWRGHALARVGAPNAVAVLTAALSDLDPCFQRAETALRVDLAVALTATNEPERASSHLAVAQTIARDIGSRRQERRILPILSSSTTSVRYPSRTK